MTAVSSAKNPTFVDGPRQVVFSFLGAEDLARVSRVARKWRSDAAFVLGQRYAKAHPALAAFARETALIGLPVTSVAPRVAAVARSYFGNLPQAQESELGRMERLAQQIYETRAVATRALLASLDDEEVNRELEKIRDLPSHEEVAALFRLMDACRLGQIYELEVDTTNFFWARRYPSTGNLFTHVPASILRFSSLADLRVEGNALTFTAEDAALLSRLPFLSNLHFSMNRIARVPDNIHYLAQLRWLDLSHNRIETLPANFGQLRNLEILNLGGNPLREVPACLHTMGGLRELRLTRTRIEWPQIQEFLIALAPHVEERTEVIVEVRFLNPAFHERMRQLAEAVKPFAKLDILVADDTHSASFVLIKDRVEPKQKKMRLEEDDSKLQTVG